MAAATPADCFSMAFEAVRLAVKYMTPVMLLSDSFLSSSAEPWRIIDPNDLPDLHCDGIPSKADFAPYRRNPETLARPWVIPGTPGLEHRIGGLEKEDVTGAVSYDAANHQKMVLCGPRRSPALPAIFRRRESLAPKKATFWSSAGAARTARSPRPPHELLHAGHKVAHLHLRYLNPFPANLGEVLTKYKQRRWFRKTTWGTSALCSATASSCRPSACPRWRAGRSASGELRGAYRKNARRTNEVSSD